MAASSAPLLFLGDSHLAYFRSAAQSKRFGPRVVQFCEVGGATAVGLRNPNSKTNALGVFRHVLTIARPGSIIVIQLGEVDCGFVIWYRAEKYGEGIESQMDESIASYFAFVDEAIELGFQRIIVTGATLPTIRDGQDWGGIANLRREVTATLRERTELTLAYNRELERNAEQRSLLYVDITADVLDPVTGVVRDEFRNADSRNHHLDYEQAAGCWVRQLERLVC